MSCDEYLSSMSLIWFFFSLSLIPLVIVPTLPDFSRHRIGHNKQYQSKYHHDRHFGPFFEDPNAENSSGTMQMGFHQGTEAVLNCRVGMLKDKTVSAFFSSDFVHNNLQ